MMEQASPAGGVSSKVGLEGIGRRNSSTSSSEEQGLSDLVSQLLSVGLDSVLATATGLPAVCASRGASPV